MIFIHKMKTPNETFLVFGATGQTGKHFLTLALEKGHHVKALVRSPDKVEVKSPNLSLHQGQIEDFNKVDELVKGVDVVIAMLGDVRLQRDHDICTDFVKQLIPAMRRQRVKRFLFQAGGFTEPYGEQLPFMSRMLKNTVARWGGLLGQHRDNEAVLKYLVEEASDIDWTVHRASIISNGPSKGVLIRSKSKFSLATFIDCASYNYQMLSDLSSIHTYDLSYYSK